MTTFTDPTAFVKNIGRYGDKIKAAESKALKAAALAAVTDIRAEASQFGITRRKKKSPLTARYEQAGSSVEIMAKNPGSWTIIEEGSRPHFIGGPRRRGGFIGPVRQGRRSKRKVVVVPGRGVFAYVQHPGHGSVGHPWEKGVAKARDSAPDEFMAVIRKIFD